MKSADIKVGETYAHSRGKYWDPRPVKVLAVGRYGHSWKPGDKPSPSKYAQIVVVIEYEQYGHTAVGTVPPGQITGLWSEIGPKVEAEQKAKAEQQAERRRQEAETVRRWEAVAERVDALGIEGFEISKWYRGDSNIYVPLEVMEALIERISTR